MLLSARTAGFYISHVHYFKKHPECSRVSSSIDNLECVFIYATLSYYSYYNVFIPGNYRCLGEVLCSFCTAHFELQKMKMFVKTVLFSMGSHTSYFTAFD